MKKFAGENASLVKNIWKNVVYTTITLSLVSVLSGDTKNNKDTTKKNDFDEKNKIENVDHIREHYEQYIRGRADSIQKVALNFFDNREHDLAMPKYLEALNMYNYLDSLNNEKDIKNENGIENLKNIYYCNLDIGKIYFYSRDYESSITNFNSALDAVKKTEYHRGQIIALTFLIRAYSLTGQEDQLENHYQKGRLLIDEIKEEGFDIESDKKMNSLYIKFLHYSAAGFYNNNEFERFKEIMDELKHISPKNLDEDGLRLFYSNMGDMALMDGKYRSALHYFNILEDISNENDPTSANVYIGKAKVYENIGNYKKAYRYYRLYENVAEKETNERIRVQNDKNQAQYKAQYEELFKAKDKQEQIDKQEKEIKEKERRNKNLIYTLFIVLGVSGGLGIMYNQMRRARKIAKQEKLNAEDAREIAEAAKEIANSAKTEAEEAREIAEEAREEEKSAKENVEKTNRELEKAKKELETKNEELKKAKVSIDESIRAANKIQEIFLPKKEEINKISSEDFILFKPRDVVSGDFYRTKKIDEKDIFAQIDYEGHGVPGALLSMLGHFILEDATKRGNTTPADIMNYFDVKINEIFHERGGTSAADIMIVSYDKKTGELTYAGSKSEMLFIPNQKEEIKEEENIKKYEDNTGISYLIKGEKDRLGKNLYGEKYENKKNKFKNRIINISNGGMLYMFSDGYKDQFSIDGGKEKKFMKKHFIELLMGIKKMPIEQQEKLLKKHIEDLITSNGMQIDDISVFGFRFDKIEKQEENV